MKSYTVHGYQLIRRTITIEAETPEKATLQAIQDFEGDIGAGSFYDCESPITEIIVDETGGNLDLIYGRVVHGSGSAIAVVPWDRRKRAPRWNL